MDFTIEKYRELLEALKAHGAFALRHDVDLRPDYSLRIAKAEAEMGLNATYYFRTVPKSYDEKIIRQIVSLGHTAGYHYECLTTCNGDLKAAYEDFCHNLEKLRKVAPITTACAHGSPLSPWNSQEMWESSRLVGQADGIPRDLLANPTAYHETLRLVGQADSIPQDDETTGRWDIHALGIDYEPMLDTDFSRTLYLTDTGRRWDGYKVSVRDKVPQYQEQWISEGLVFHSTDDIIHAINDTSHPIRKYNLLINTHPQRWMPFGIGWLKEATLQNIKNIAKRIIVKKQ